MEQPHPDELPTIRVNVGQLLQDLKKLATFARPTEQRLQAGSSSEKASCASCERRLKTLAPGRLKRLAPDVVLLL